MQQKPPPPAPVAVFCGSRSGRCPEAAALAAELGRALARAGHTLIYGGGRRGIMGVLAEAALAEGGTVIGVIPDFLRQAELAHPGLSALEITFSMHERKQRMFALAEAFVTLPGGIGTLDETIEIVTWRQLGLHTKPIYLMECGHWSRGIRAALQAAHADGFAGPPESLIEFVPDVAALLPRLAGLTPVSAAVERL